MTWFAMQTVMQNVMQTVMQTVMQNMTVCIPLLAVIMLAAMRATFGPVPYSKTAFVSRNMSSSLCTPSKDSVSESSSSSLSLSGIVSPVQAQEIKTSIDLTSWQFDSQ